MREISVSQFRQQCLTLLDHLPADGLLLTRHGHPVAKLLPVVNSCASLLGAVPGLVVDPTDDLLETGTTWEAQQA